MYVLYNNINMMVETKANQNRTVHVKGRTKFQLIGSHESINASAILFALTPNCRCREY